jgi:hypothetical protein
MPDEKPERPRRRVGAIRKVAGGWEAHFGQRRVMGPIWYGPVRHTYEKAEEDLNRYFAGYEIPGGRAEPRAQSSTAEAER